MHDIITLEIRPTQLRLKSVPPTPNRKLTHETQNQDEEGRWGGQPSCEPGSTHLLGA